jgi:hypothetical protein
MWHLVAKSHTVMTVFLVTLYLILDTSVMVVVTVPIDKCDCC